MWKKYFKKHEKRSLKPQLVRAVDFSRGRYTALDLGSGTFIESKYLAKKFKHVTAVDHSPDANIYAKRLPKNLIFQNTSFQEFKFGKYDLISSQMSLHLHGHKGFNSFIKKIKDSLNPGGIFVGQFLGVKDSWNTASVPFPSYDYVFHTKKQVLSLLSGMKILEFIEEDREGKTIHGKEKHWHILNFIAQKIR